MTSSALITLCAHLRSSSSRFIHAFFLSSFFFPCENSWLLSRKAKGGGGGGGESGEQENKRKGHESEGGKREIQREEGEGREHHMKT